MDEKKLSDKEKEAARSICEILNGFPLSRAYTVLSTVGGKIGDTCVDIQNKAVNNATFNKEYYAL